uniref:Uncharacterized protein n=1 Tax=Laticauda laticaudata TaxID=8630 RepID=A0A8C5SCJ4_LATLA
DRPSLTRRLSGGGGAGRRRGAVVPLQGAERWRTGTAVLPQPGAGFPVRSGALHGSSLARPRLAGQRAPQRQRPAAVGLAGRAAGSAARLRALLLVGRRLHAFPVRQRAAGHRLPGLLARRAARQRPLPPLSAAPLGRRQPQQQRRRRRGRAGRVRGIHRGAGRHAGHRGRHDGRRGLHLRHAGPHLPPGGLPDREPHARLGQARQLKPPPPAGFGGSLWRAGSPFTGPSDLLPLWPDCSSSSPESAAFFQRGTTNPASPGRS